MTTLPNAVKPEEMLDIEADEPVESTQGDLERARDLARQQVEAEDRVAKCQADLKAAVTALEAIADDVLPKFMDEKGLTEFATTEGWKVKVAEVVRAGVPSVDKNPEGNKIGLEHLESIGQGELIKRTFTIYFSKGDEAWAKKFARDLSQRKKPLDFELKSTVHAGTLSAFIRERKELGKLTDDDRRLLGVYETRTAEVKRPKAKGAKKESLDD